MRKSKTQKQSTIKTADQLEEQLSQYSEQQNRIKALETDLNERLRLVREEYEGRFTAANAAATLIFDDIELWAAEHPDSFIKRKSLDLLHGTVGFRTGQPRVTLPRGVKEDVVVREMQEAGDVNAWLRTSVELDRAGMIAGWQGDDCATVQELLGRFGIKVVQSERFYIEPKTEDAPDGCETLTV